MVLDPDTSPMGHFRSDFFANGHDGDCSRHATQSVAVAASQLAL
jgi:hypothetical protein